MIHFIPGDPQSPLLIISDHNSSHVPPDVELGIEPALLTKHIAVDIGIDPLSRALAEHLQCPAVLAGVSRLVVDLNRDEDEPGAIPIISDGHPIAGNEALDPEGREERLGRFWRPYHAAVAARIEELEPRMLVSLHSFTPKLASRPEEQRPWEIGILYNRDDRAARIGINLLEQAGIPTGDNQPYSGRILNATMNRHGEARDLPYLGIEVRQDLIDTDAGVRLWAGRLAPIIRETHARLASAGPIIQNERR